VKLFETKFKELGPRAQSSLHEEWGFAWVAEVGDGWNVAWANKPGPESLITWAFQRKLEGGELLDLPSLDE
ncbi:MAG: hypothetical protein AAF802_16840, partial [Planctomycetota bacterium]